MDRYYETEYHLFLSLHQQEYLQEWHIPETRLKGCGKENTRLVEEDQFRKYLNKLSMCQIKYSDVEYPWVLGEFTNVIVRALAIILYQSWWLG